MFKEVNNPSLISQSKTFHLHKPVNKAYNLANDAQISLNSALFLIEAYNTHLKSGYSLFRHLYGYTPNSHSGGLLRRLIVKGYVNKPTRNSLSVLTKLGKELVSKYI